MRPLAETTERLTSAGRGILAADESFPTIEKRFRALGIPSTEETRRSYRELLFSVPEIARHLAGVILFDETIRQRAAGGEPFPELLEKRGIAPGIKVDRGSKDLAGFPGEKVTEGLDGLRERFAEYHGLGARFSKWRAVIVIGDGLPTRFSLETNAHALARYAALSQEAGIVPVVEPEVLMDGDHSLERCEEVTEATLRILFSALGEGRVVLEALLLKPNMVVAGKSAPQQPSVDEVAEATVRCLRRTVPAAVPGVFFLSGGQSPQQATRHLDAIVRRGPHPWQVSFSFARALQGEALERWGGDPAKAREAQEVFLRRAACVAAAREGRYTEDMEPAA